MLEGLEISVLSLREAISEETSDRIDAEFFQRKYVHIQNHLENLKSKHLSAITTKIDVGFVGSMVSEYTDKGIVLIQTKNVNEFFLNLDDPIKINSRFHLELKKSQVKYGDVLIARSGSFGKASIYLKEEVVNSSDIIIVAADKASILPEYLVAFLNSEMGSSQLFRFASGGLQGHVNLTILENLKVPILSDTFQISIRFLVKAAHSAQEQSKTLYAEAERVLLEELGINETIFQTPVHEVVSNVKTFADMGDSWRLDAEYYQPKYDE